ncbi:hypothetical protein ATE84_2731 [Aquimarina sp. MAR_2010_214]|uniref:hypothetical protein n=1 Tax=Aquimarina sp. MAR_2010_214 TaxID=1250026 RepID=UPI000C6FE8B8|nr:hypothetical protein [Aquimarina sp. MAR_2010_214]PKV50665.1 hypothetical protein ATE84_2731 [Aquimarina sp. MAR_2010_214]
MSLKIKKYFKNCFLLLIPIFLWNIIFVDALPKSYSPEIFWKDIPKTLNYSENILRIIVLTIPAIMIFSLKTRVQKIGFVIYLIGIILYFLSWICMIAYPLSNWSQSMIGFVSPACTTIIWFVGIGLIGNKTFFRILNLSVIYILIALIFVGLHSLHAYIVYQRL